MAENTTKSKQIIRVPVKRKQDSSHDCNDCVLLDVCSNFQEPTEKESKYISNCQDGTYYTYR